MTRLTATPHLQTSRVAGHDWLVTIRGETRPAAGLLDGWDYSTPLHLQSRVSLSPSEVRDDCGLPADAELAVVALYRSSSTNRRGLGVCVPLTTAGDVELAFDLPAGAIGGKLLLQRQLVLLRSGRPTSGLAATEPGSILWDEDRADRAELVLEGDATRFPSVVDDFAASGLADSGAGWYLEHDFGDLDASPLSAVRVHINGSHPVMKELIEQTSSEGAIIMQSILRWDVGRQMICAALDQVDFVERWGTFEPESLGEVLELLVRSTWPNHDARSLLSFRADDPAGFEAALQARMGALEGGR